jgi:hypothetical protein
VVGLAAHALSIFEQEHVGQDAVAALGNVMEWGRPAGGKYSDES